MALPYGRVNLFLIVLKPNDIGGYMMRGTFVEAHIADIHFGALDPSVQYKILQEQFISKIRDLPLDIISINGDLFDKKFMANSDVITYATGFIADLVDI